MGSECYSGKFSFLAKIFFFFFFCNAFGILKVGDSFVLYLNPYNNPVLILTPI